MITDEEFVAVWLVMWRIFRRNREREDILARRVNIYFLLAIRLLQQRNNQRGPYCITPPAYNERVLGTILRGDCRSTRRHLRVTPASFHRIAALVRRNHKRSGWCVEVEVTLFLFWLATGIAYRVVAACFDIPLSTVGRIVHKMLRKILSILPDIVRLPSVDRLPEIGLQFARRADSAVFRQCVGAIDGCHIRIQCPVRLHDQYYNRKQFYSINLQGLVDASGLFIDILSGFPGSVHDARVFRNSALFQQSLYPPEGYYIIGDSAYPCRRHPITIITPFTAPLTEEQTAFNRALSQARMVVERVFGIMKTRWRSIFTKALEVKIQTAIKVIAACTVLHNICVSQGDVLRVDVHARRLPPRRVPRAEREGLDLRNLLLQLFTLEQRNNLVAHVDE